MSGDYPEIETTDYEETGATEKIGIVDEPLAKEGEDLLKIRRYSNALIKYIKNAQTPTTIGIQGEWGSGKTSLLNTIYTELDKANQDQNTKDFKVVWINSWENSLMATPEEALIKIINEIINTLVEVDPKVSNITKVKEAATVAAKGILRVGAGILGGQAGGSVMEEVLESSNSIRDLRLQLTTLINEIRASENQRVDKIVIFVDDLDRIDPPEAVKILELLKNIFSIPGCVFVLAIDYQVVIKGLKEKFGERTPENEWEFRAFFDKIIQLPFLMPIGSYDIGNYVNDLLRQIGFQDENEIDSEFVSETVKYTIGGNPRSLKRLINSLALINIFNQEAGDEDQDDEDIDITIERQLLFALVCLQISSSEVYDPAIQSMNSEKYSDIEVYENLAIADIQDAADLLADTYSNTRVQNGYVSLEVNPHLANDTDGTVAEAERLHKRVDRPNLMIKVPATKSGIPAIHQLISKGISVNVTLIFSTEMYSLVREAYLSGLENLHANGADLSKVISVASFFVSRVDTAVDNAISEEKLLSDELKGMAGIANAKIAYKDFRDTFSSVRFEKLREAGANIQRPLWASTSMKNPALRDVLYVENLVGQDTVNTMPDVTLNAFIDHGKSENTITKNVNDSYNHINELIAGGIDMSAITEELLKDGVRAFADSFDQLLENISHKRSTLSAVL